MADALDLSIISILMRKLIKNDNIFDRAIIDNNSLKIIDGSVVDFKKELIGNSFVINNPQASSSCGCGLSFSV